MKVVKEATKEQKEGASLPRRSMRSPVANGVTAVPHIDGLVNDAVEVKSPTSNSEEKVSPSRVVQQSVRRSKFSGELERDMALPTPQPSARLPTATPLNPVTPLRWKSSKRLEMEKKKLQEEIKAKEAAKEEKKNSKPAKEERKDQISKMTAISKPEGNVVQASHKLDKGTRFSTASASTSESTVLTQANGKTGDLKHSPSASNGSSDKHASQSEETSPLHPDNGLGRSNGDSGIDRKPHAGDDSSVITVDFLRARLLAERASSKAAKERVQKLTEKVLELEGRLDQEIQSRKKAEEAAQEALSKYELLEKTGKQVSEGSKILEPSTSLPENLKGSNQVSGAAMISAPPSPHEKMKNEQEDHELSDQTEETCQVLRPVEEDDEASPNATVVTKPDHTLSVSSDSKDGNELEVQTSEDKATPSPDQEIGDIQSLKKVMSHEEVQQDPNRTVPRVVSTGCDSICSANSALEQQKRRFAVEERLRHMWDQITEEMAALAEDKTQEELVREQLLNWMGQIPSVLQEILPKPSEDKKLVIESSTKKDVELKDGDIPPASFHLDQVQKEDSVEDISLSGASSGRIQEQSLKKVASLIEQFEAQESSQRELEQSYAKQNSTGRRRSNEGSMSRTNSNSGIPHSVESQRENQQEQLEDLAPTIVSQTEGPKYDSHATNTLVSPRRGKSTGSFHAGKENGKVDIQTPESSITSTYPDPPTVGEVVERSGEEGITYTEAERSDDFILKDAETGSESRSLVPSFITAPFHSAGENGGDSGRSLMDRSQVVLKQSNHHLNHRALEGFAYEKALVSNIERSELEPHRSQVLAGWVNLEDAQTYTAPTNKGESALQWDASLIGLHLQHEKLGSYSQAGNSNAYMRPEVPGTYPLRNEEREIYRGRMESVSRSMEGLRGSWMSLSDPEGDEIQPYADHIPESNESGSTRIPGLQMPFQVNGTSERSNNYQAESMVGMSQNFAYPGREFSRDNFQSRPSTKLENTTASKVNEVLKALQLAKLSIQKTGARRISISNPCYSTSEHSYSGGEKHNLKTDYGFYGADGMTSRSPVGIRIWSHQELSRRYSTGSFREAGSPPRLQHSNSSAPFHGMVIDARGKDPEEDHPLAGRSSPVSNARRKFVDKISTGGGVQYFYPN